MTDTTQMIPVYAVVRWAGMWRVLGPDAVCRIYSWQIDAEEAALKLANSDRGRGLPATVLLQDQFGEMRRLDGAP